MFRLLNRCNLHALAEKPRCRHLAGDGSDIEVVPGLEIAIN